jgi:hypothetical protein
MSVVKKSHQSLIWVDLYHGIDWLDGLLSVTFTAFNFTQPNAALFIIQHNQDDWGHRL